MLLKSKIDKKEILKYLGYQNQTLTETFHQEMEEAIEEILKVAEPKNIWKSLPRKEIHQVLLGENIQEHLGDAEQVILLAATLGQAVDFVLRRSQSIDIKHAVILDATASVAIESYLNQQEDQLRARFLSHKQYLSTRFSPGYGDLPLSVQLDFLKLIDTGRKIGLNITDKGLMSPMKSVTCIMAISDQPIANVGDPCSICQFKENCGLRRRGGYCGRFRKE